MMKVGIVESFDDKGLFVKINGEEKAREKNFVYLSSYAPTVGDKVLIFIENGDYIALGKIMK